MKLCLVDTDTLSEILKQKNPQVMVRAEAYFRHFGAFTFSAVTWNEITRGLRASGATTKIVRFEEFVAHSTVLPVTPQVLDLAADLWVAARGRRQRTYDADILIAATAQEQNAIVVTGNVRHFGWMPGISFEDWRQPLP